MTRQYDDPPVEFWPTASIRSALETGDISIWQRIVVAIKRDPYGRTARQVEEVLEAAAPYGVSTALTEVLGRARNHLAANERAEAEFASRIGVTRADLSAFLDATVSPPASLMIRMRRLSDRFAKMRAQQAQGQDRTETNNSDDYFQSDPG